MRRPELAYRGWPKNATRLAQIKMRPYQGCCYIASHAFSQLTGAEVWATDDGMHYWNKIDGEIWDLTKEQFNYEFIYDGHRVPRKNKNNLPVRVKELLNECGRSNSAS